MPKIKESFYILYRKIVAYCNSALYILCSFLPIQKDKIAICTFEGRTGFGCNPRYIVEELHKRNDTYRFYWFVNDMDKIFPSYIRKVKNNAWNRARHLSTAKIWIDNYRKPYGTRKRKGQFYFQTWHGSIGFKSIGLWRGSAFSRMAYLVSKNDSDMIDYVTIDSEWCREMFPKGLVYEGEFLKTGAPRCDVLYGDRKKARIEFRKRFSLHEQDHVVMFAPTFREGKKDGVRQVFSEEWTIDFERMLRNLEKRFGGTWYLCIRVHPQLACQFQQDFKAAFLADRMMDVSQEDDLYEILAAMDAFITDYSSAAMDAGFTHMPVFIYADDIEQYVCDRGSSLWNFSSEFGAPVPNNKVMTPGIHTVLPYSVARNNEELEQNILSFDQETYHSGLLEFERAVGLVFDGQASRRVADKIEKCIND